MGWKSAVWLGLAGAVLAVNAAQAQDAKAPARPRRNLPVEGAAITNPDWVTKPTGEQFAHYYPPLAAVIDEEGFAKIRCLVAVQGNLTDCSIVEESPAGFGFGNAALSMAQYFRMRPQTVDGQPIGGASVTIPLTFILGLDPTPPLPPPPPSLPAETLARARRLVTALGMEKQFENQIQDGLNRSRQRLGPLADTPMGQKIFTELAKATPASMPKLVDQAVYHYAAVFTPDQLTALAAFFESPAGQAWAGQQASNAHALDGPLNVVWAGIAAQARAAICKQAGCPAPPSAAPP